MDIDYRRVLSSMLDNNFIRTWSAIVDIDHRRALSSMLDNNFKGQGAPLWILITEGH